MGNLVTKAAKVAIRKTNRYNAENRAFKEMERQQIRPVVAPKHESNVREFERLMEAEPELLKKANEFNKDLDSRLKQVYVTSDLQPPVPPRRSRPDRPLPLERTTGEDHDFGFKEPDRVSPGKITLRQAAQFLTEHRMHPEECTPERIAEDYKLKPEVVANILQHFRSFEVYVPLTKNHPKMSSMPLLKAGKQVGKLDRDSTFDDMMDASKYTLEGERKKLGSENTKKVENVNKDLFERIRERMK